MSEVYITDYLSRMKNIEFGKWYPEEQAGDGLLEQPIQIPFVVYDNIIEGLIRADLSAGICYNGRGKNRYMPINVFGRESLKI